MPTPPRGKAADMVAPGQIANFHTLFLVSRYSRLVLLLRGLPFAAPLLHRSSDCWGPFPPALA